MKTANCVYRKFKRKTVIALWGVSNAGKSTAIKMVFKLLQSKYKLKEDQITFLSKPGQSRCDISTYAAILLIKDMKVGIEHRGDPNSALQKV